MDQETEHETDYAQELCDEEEYKEENYSSLEEYAKDFLEFGKSLPYYRNNEQRLVSHIIGLLAYYTETKISVDEYGCVKVTNKKEIIVCNKCHKKSEVNRLTAEFTNGGVLSCECGGRLVWQENKN